MMSKFPGSDHSCRRRYVIKLLSERSWIIRIIRTRKTTYASVCKSRTKQTRKKVTGVTRQWTEVTRTSTDCQTTFLDVWSNLENFWKKSLNGHATVVGGHATVGQLSNNVFGRFKRLGNFLKKVAELSRDSGRRSRDRRPTVKQRFLDVSSNLKKFWKKSLNGHATVVGGHATVGRLSNNVFGRFKRLGKSDFWLKKVAERSRDSGRRSRDRRPTVKQRFLDVSSDLKILKKVAERSRDSGRRPSADCQTTFFGRFKQFDCRFFGRSRDSGRRSRDRRPTVKQRFLDVSSN